MFNYYISRYFYFFLKGLGTYLWQNFLTDSKIRHWIADKIAVLYEQLGADCLVEIWPGKGSLTKLIKDVSQNFVVIEKDETLREKLEEILQGEGRIIMDDVLNVDVSLLWSYKNALVVGNLPYYITSPILRKFFVDSFTKSPSGVPRSGLPLKSPAPIGASPFTKGGVFMVQEEVGEKIRFDAKKKSYLYWLLNYGYHVEYLKTVPVKAFNPPPKVKSCVIGLKRKDEIPAIEFERLVSFLDAFAPYSRKTLGKISKMLEKRGVSFAIPEEFQSKRLEELDWGELEEIVKK